MQQYDLIATGAECLDGDQSLGAFLAGSLKRYHYRREQMEVKPEGSGLVHLALPAVISITGASLARPLNMTESIDATYAPLRVVEPLPESKPASRFALPGGARAGLPLSTDSLKAAEFIKAYAAAASAGMASDYKDALAKGTLPDDHAVWALLEPDDRKGNLAVLRACSHAASLTGVKAYAVIPAPRAAWPQLLGLAQANGCEQAFCVDSHEGRLSKDGKRELLRRMLRTTDSTLIFAGAEWTTSLAYAAGEAEAHNRKIMLCSGVTDMEKETTGALVFSLPAYQGKLLRQYGIESGSAFVTIAAEADFPAQPKKKNFRALVLDLAVDPDWVMPLPPVAPPTLSQADVLIDLGYGIKDSAGIKLAQELKEKLESLGLAPMFGATRKVTQDLKLLPLEAQIGQTGVRVNPKLIIALGISGAPQHIDYVGTRAEILCFNKDSEAPLMNLNQNRPSPRVHPILGDLFITVRQVLEKLG
jgi:AhpD family alkylhydroperoxidase